MEHQQYKTDVLNPLSVIQNEETLLPNYEGTPIINQDDLNSGDVQNRNWWSTIAKGIINAPPFGGAVLYILDEFGIGLPRLVNVIDPQELIEVDTWILNLFTPFIQKMTGRSESIINQSILTSADLQSLNETLNKLCIVKTHFATNDQTTFLSDDALDYRFQLIVAATDAIENKIKSRINILLSNATGFSVNVDPAKYDLSQIITTPTGLVTCTNYKVGSTTTPTVQNTATATTTTATAAIPTKTIGLGLIGLAVAVLFWPNGKKAKLQE